MPRSSGDRSRRSSSDRRARRCSGSIAKGSTFRCSRPASAAGSTRPKHRDAARLGDHLDSLDHTHILGGTIAEIAGEKAGIIKPAVPVAVAPQQPDARRVIEGRAAVLGAPVTLVGRDVAIDRVEPFEPIQAGQPLLTTGYRQAASIRGRLGQYRLRLPLLGRHQVENAGHRDRRGRVAAVTRPAAPDGAIEAGIAGVRWPARLDILASAPIVVADAAHNVDSARRLAESLDEYFLLPPVDPGVRRLGRQGPAGDGGGARSEGGRGRRLPVAAFCGHAGGDYPGHLRAALRVH